MKNILNILFNPSKNNLKEGYEENKMIFYDNTNTGKWSNGLSEWKVKGQDTQKPIVIQQPTDMSCSEFEKLITSKLGSYKKGETNKTYTSTIDCLNPTTKETYTVCKEQPTYDFETSLVIDKTDYIKVLSKDMLYVKLKYPYFEILNSKITSTATPYLYSLIELIKNINGLKNNKESSSNIDYELTVEGDNAQILANETENIKQIINKVCNLILENKPINEILLEFLKIFCVKYGSDRSGTTIGFYHYLVDKINYIQTMNTLTSSNKLLNNVKTISKGSTVVVYNPNDATSPSEITSSCLKKSDYHIIVSGNNYLSWNNIDNTKVIYLNKSTYNEVPNRCMKEPKHSTYNSKSGNVALYEPEGENITFEVVDLCNLVLNPKKINCGARLANRIFYTNGRPGMFVPSYAYNNKKYPDNLQIGLLPAFYANFSTPDQNPITITIKGICIKRSNNATDYYILLPESTTKKDQSFKIQVNRLKYGSTNFNKQQDMYPLLRGDGDWNDATYKNILNSWLKSELGNNNITTNSYTSVGIVPFTDNINLPEVQTEKCVGRTDEYPIKITFSKNCPENKKDEFENIIKSNIKLWVNISVVSHTFNVHTGVNLDHKYQKKGRAHLKNNASDIENWTTTLNGFKGNPIKNVKRYYNLDSKKKTKPAGNSICTVSQVNDQFGWNHDMFQDVYADKGVKYTVEGSTWNLNNSLNIVSTLKFDYIKTNDSTTQYKIYDFKNYSNNNFMIKSRITEKTIEYYDNLAKQVLGYHTVNNYQGIKSIGKYNVNNKLNEKRNKIFPYNPLYTNIDSNFRYNEEKPKLLDWYNIKSYTLNEDFTIKDGEYLRVIRDNFNEIFVKFGQETFNEISNILQSSKNYFLPHIVETEFKDINGSYIEQSILPPGVFSKENIFTQEYHNPINGFIIEYNNGAVKKISDNLIFKPNQGCYELTLNIPRIPTDDINEIKNNDSYELKLRLRDKSNTNIKDGGYTTIIDKLPLLTLENTTDHFFYGLKNYVLEYQSQGEDIKNVIMKIESLETSRNKSKYIKINVNIIKVDGTVGSIKCKKYDTY